MTTSTFPILPVQVSILQYLAQHRLLNFRCEVSAFTSKMHGSWSDEPRQKWRICSPENRPFQKEHYLPNHLFFSSSNVCISMVVPKIMGTTKQPFNKEPTSTSSYLGKLITLTTFSEPQMLPWFPSMNISGNAVQLWKANWFRPGKNLLQNLHHFPPAKKK